MTDLARGLLAVALLQWRNPDSGSCAQRRRRVDSDRIAGREGRREGVVLALNGHHLLVERKRAEQTKGHGAALRWVLSLIWIYVYRAA